MKYLAVTLLVVSLIGCGDDTKKASSENVSSNNTTTANNTTTDNNTTTGNNTTANNNVAVTSLDLGPDNDPISSINVAQACEKTQDYFAANVSEAESKKFGCLIGGAISAAFGEYETDAALQAACTATYDECMTEPVDPNPDETCDLEPTDCAVKIGLVEDCVEGQVSGFKTVVSTFTCSDLTLESDPSVFMEAPTACDQIEAACPDFFGADE